MYEFSMHNELSPQTEDRSGRSWDRTVRCSCGEFEFKSRAEHWAHASMALRGELAAAVGLIQDRTAAIAASLLDENKLLDRMVTELRYECTDAWTRCTDAEAESARLRRYWEVRTKGKTMHEREEEDYARRLAVAANDLLDFMYSGQLPIDEPKSRMIKLANVLYAAILNLPDDDDPGTEYGPGGSVDPAPDAKR